MCRQGCAIAGSLKQIFAQRKIFLEGTLATVKFNNDKNKRFLPCAAIAGTQVSDVPIEVMSGFKCTWTQINFQNVSKGGEWSSDIEYLSVPPRASQIDSLYETWIQELDVLCYLDS